MPHPVVASVNYSEETADTTTHDVLVPTGIVAGNLLMLLSGIDGNATSQPTITDWTNIMWFQSVANVSLGIWYKFASGSETDFTYTTSVSERSVNRTWRVTGAHPSTPPESPSGGPDGFASSFNMFSMTPSWGSDDNLFCVFLATSQSGSSLIVNTYPTGFSDNQFVDQTGTGTEDAGIATATRPLTAASHNPDSFVLANSVSGIGRSFVIRPVSVPSLVMPVHRNRSRRMMVRR